MTTDYVFEGNPDCEHDWLPLMFGERQCTKCGRVEYD